MLVTKSISKFFDGFKALDRVCIAVEPNKLTLIVGPNGSGKTTLINIISGFYRADEGHVFFNGEEITNKPPHKIYTCGIVRTFQIPQPLKKLSVLENLLIAVDNPGERIKRCIGRSWEKREGEIVDKAFKLLDFLELADLWDMEAWKLSGGQLKLLEAGRALMADAKLIIMDEPMMGVNPTLASSILDKIMALKKYTTFLIIEHRFEIISRYVDTVYVMVNGRTAEEGSEEFKEVIRMLCFE
jgi:branched-chain amino acid transport system ATP-binding protein